MNWDAVGALAELLGAVAVVVSLLYVATQVRESTRQARGGADPSQLTRGDQARYRGLMNALFPSLEQQYLFRKEGALDDESWRAVEHYADDAETSVDLSPGTAATNQAP